MDWSAIAVGTASGMATATISGLFLLKMSKKDKEHKALRRKYKELLINVEAYAYLEVCLLNSLAKNRRNGSIATIRRRHRDIVRAKGYLWTKLSQPNALANEKVRIDTEL